jgi:hypothetical protein
VRRRRVLLCALAALAVPLHAFATTGGDPAPAPLEVTASLDECGLLQNQIVCKIDATWGTVDGATSYQASVTRPDGSVVDEGEVADGGSSFWVPYAGDGAYHLQITAYGEVDADPAPDVVAKANATAGGDAPQRGGAPESRFHGAGGDGSAKPAADGRSGGRADGPKDPKPSCDEAPADAASASPAPDPAAATTTATTTDATAQDQSAAPDPTASDCPQPDPASEQPAPATGTPDAAGPAATP